uniref:Uncharacterized protein n=1 Tax=Ditylenchus dipsaci TaxID=166011 RepID=A0A915E2Q3_9BILA
MDKSSTSNMSLSSNKSRDVSNLHTEIFDFLCTYHRVKRIPSKDTNPGAIVENSLSNEQRGELINRSLYKILNAIELRISVLPSTSEPTTTEYYDEWRTFLDYGGKHFQEKINTALVDLVNKAQRMQPPINVQPNDPHFERFYQAYVTSLISLHDLYTMFQQKWLYSEFEAQIAVFKEQLTTCFQYQREFCNNHGYLLWRQMRESQIQKMTRYCFDNKGFLEGAVSFTAICSTIWGFWLLGFCYETRNSKVLSEKPDLISPLLQMVYAMVDILLSDSICSIEPSQNAILVTNNLFPMKIVSLSSSARNAAHENFEPPVPIRPTPSAALLAMKPSTGVKRNNATASAGGGGNTAHKKSDVNSKEWIHIPPTFDSEQQAWVATYPHLLCTTRQKDTLLDSRSAGQTGKRPLFYFHVKAEMFSFARGTFGTAHTLSLPFTIATRRNQDCQVQRMMSSYTATCFWLYGSNVLDGLIIQWYDNEIEWKHFKILYAQYFALNAEVIRSLTDEDFAILRLKMHCPECSDRVTAEDEFSENNQHHQQPSTSSITFKNVLCPHLHYANSKTDVRFSIWRGMLELLHLFNDQRTDVKNLWESGLLQGFMEMETVHALLQTTPESALVMRLSFVIGGCVCFTVKSNNQIINLEPLDIRRLQAKSLHEYLRDILIAEKIEYVLNSNHDWIHVNEAIKLCQKSSNSSESCYNQTSKEITSNIMYSGAVEVEQTIRFTPMRVAVVTCKPAGVDEKIDSPQLATTQRSRQWCSSSNSNSIPEAEFEEKLEVLMRTFGKTAHDLLEWASGSSRKRSKNSSSQPTVMHPPHQLGGSLQLNNTVVSASTSSAPMSSSYAFTASKQTYLSPSTTTNCNGHALLMLPNEGNIFGGKHESQVPSRQQVN